MNKTEIDKMKNEAMANGSKVTGFDGDASGAPINEGSILVLRGKTGLNDNNGHPWAYFESEEGQQLSYRQITRNGNGIQFKSKKMNERVAEIIDAIGASAGGSISLRVTKIAQKKVLFNGDLSMKNYYYFSLA